MKIKTNVFGKILLSGVMLLIGAALTLAQTTFNSTATIQTYTVPGGVTTIGISASGAQGGTGGGLGATMYGEFTVIPGEVLTIIVGEEGFVQLGGQVENSSGGGGGSFVYNSSNTLLIAAGGGGGMCMYNGSVPLHADAHGKITEDGGFDSSGAFAGGTGGNGGMDGQWSASPCAGGGTGWLTPGVSIYGGQNATGSWVGGDPFCGGGGGGCGGYGGFGGGGGGGNHYGGGGGGGGYSGGGGGGDPDHGGGGGSYNSGANQNNVGGAQSGNGVVVITEFCDVTALDMNVTQVDVMLTSDQAGATYQWLNCDSSYAVVTGETNQSFTSAITGNFAVEVTIGQCVDTSSCFLVDYSGFEDILTENDVLIYPNPSQNGQFNISYSGTISSVEILDMLGRSVFVLDDIGNKLIDTSHLDSGNYIVLVKSNNSSVKKELIIMK